MFLEGHELCTLFSKMIEKISIVALKIRYFVAVDMESIRNSKSIS